MIHLKRFFAVAALLLPVAFAACDDTTVAPPVEPIEVKITPGSDLALKVGQKAMLQIDVSNAEFAAADIQILNSTPTVASAAMDAEGVLTIEALAAGATNVVARHTPSSASDEISVVVTQDPVPPTPEVTVTITPQAAAISVGETVKLSSAVSGSANKAVTWQSLDPMVATIDSTGSATGVGAGTVVILATAKADPLAIGSATLSVTAPSQDVTVAIASITQGGNTVNPNNVSGLIDVTVNADLYASFVGTIEVLLNDVIVGSQSINQNSAPGLEKAAASMVFPISTAALNETKTAPRLLNGSYALKARVTAAQNVQASVSTNLELNNADALLADLSYSKSASNPATAQVWKGGDITLSLRPILYSGRPLKSANFGFCNPGVAAADIGTTNNGTVVIASDTVAADGISYTFLADSTTTATLKGTQGLELQVAACVTGTNYDNGEAGPDRVMNDVVGYAPGSQAMTFRLDNKAPVITANTFNLDALSTALWIRGATAFAAPTYTDAGSAGVVCEFFVGAAAINTDSLTQKVATGADIAETLTNASTGARADCTDLLGNVSKIALTNGAGAAQKFGVDKTKPGLAVNLVPGNALADSAILTADGGERFYFTPSDTSIVGTAGPSGFSATPLKARIEVQAKTVSDANKCTLAAMVSGACPYADVASDFSMAYTVDGYYTLTAYAKDLAGNESASIVRRILIDGIAPSVTGMTSPDSLYNGGALIFQSVVSDNVDLDAIGMYVQHGGAWNIAMSAQDTYGTPFDGSLENQVTYTKSPAFLASIENVDGANAPSGAFNQATAFHTVAVDVADNVGAANSNIAAKVYGRTTSYGVTEQIQTFTIDWNGTVIDKTETIQLKAVAQGAPSVFANPFTSVRFMIAETWNGNTVYRALATQGNTTVNDDGVTRTYTYSLSFNAAAYAGSTVNIVAIGIGQDGSGLASAIGAITVNP